MHAHVDVDIYMMAEHILDDLSIWIQLVDEANQHLVFHLYTSVSYMALDASLDVSKHDRSNVWV